MDKSELQMDAKACLCLLCICETPLPPTHNLAMKEERKLIEVGSGIQYTFAELAQLLEILDFGQNSHSIKLIPKPYRRI
jgi:hypothetical protein